MHACALHQHCDHQATRSFSRGVEVRTTELSKDLKVLMLSSVYPQVYSFVLSLLTNNDVITHVEPPKVFNQNIYETCKSFKYILCATNCIKFKVMILQF